MEATRRGGLRSIREYPSGLIASICDMPSMVGTRCLLCGHVQGKPCICTGPHVGVPCEHHGTIGIIDAIKRTLGKE